MRRETVVRHKTPLWTALKDNSCSSGAITAATNAILLNCTCGKLQSIIAKVES